MLVTRKSSRQRSSIRTRLSAWAHHLGIGLLLTLAVVGCTGGGARDATVSPPPVTNVTPNLVIHNEKGDRVNVEDISEIQEVLPFELVIPENLPLGLRVNLVSASLPPKLGGEVNEQHIRANLGFGNKDKTAGLELTESLVAPGMDSPNIKTLRQDDTIVKVAVSEERKRVSAVWEGCGIAFVLNGGPPDQLTEDNILHIVESTLACQGPG